MKIVHILKGKANPDTMNGVNRVVHSLASTQIHQGHQVEVWGITATPESRTHNPPFPLKLFKAQKNRFSLDPKLCDEIELLPVGTVAHLHSVFLPELFATSRKLTRKCIPWVLSPHGGYAPESREKNKFIKSLYMLLFERKLIEDASTIHAIGEHGEADYFRGTPNEGRLALIPNGHTPGMIFKESWSNEGTLSLVYCGRLAVAQKGLDLLFLAISQSIEDGLDIHLSVIGDGPDRQQLKLLSNELHICNRVVFHGMQTGKAKESLLLAADVFVHTSRWEGMPTAVLEAAGMGLPLLITPQTNIGETVNSCKAGVVTSTADVDAIASSIRVLSTLKHEGHLPEIGKNSRNMIFERFSWESVSSLMTETAYQTAIQRTIHC